MTTPPRRPSAASRTTRRSRRPTQRSGTLLERNRRRLLWGAGGLGFLLIAGLAFSGFTRPTYACTSIWQPTEAPSFAAPTPAPVASGATPAPAVTPPPPGFVQPDLGNLHENSTGATITFQYCPPASGMHYTSSGIAPMRPGFYGLSDSATPSAWVHNLEHGASVLLYSCKAPEGQTAHACTDAGQEELRALYARWPASPVCGFTAGTRDTPVIARFDDMAWPYAGVVWDVVLPMETLDETALFDFYGQRAERYNRERFCALPTPRPAPTPTAGPATPTPAASPGASGASPAPTGSPAATPAATAPSPS